MIREREYRRASTVERLFNQVFGWFVGLGLSPSYNYLLEVRGRKSGRVYSVPVNLHEFGGREFLVAPRGRTQWVRNAEASGEVTLKKRGTRRRFHLRALAEAEKPEVLKSYLGRYRGTVQRFFPLRWDAPLDAFSEIAAGYPVFELTRSGASDEEAFSRGPDRRVS
jgi:deazaflavin-dependent oxidoreductase (nitroreductase family)